MISEPKRVHPPELAQHLFVLPNGSFLKFAHPGQRGPIDGWYQTRDSEALRRTANRTLKGRHFRLDLWSSNTESYVLAADFDKLPPGFNDFDSLYAHLAHVFSDRIAIKARSVSGKVKLFFLIELPPGIEMTIEIASCTFLKLFSYNRDLYSCLDLSNSGIRLSYLNRSVLEALTSGLSALRPTAGILPEHISEEGESNTSTTPMGSIRPLRAYSGAIHTLMPDANLTGVREQFLRILLESKQLGSVGFGISTKKIANQLGVTQQLISRIRIEFVRRGWLVGGGHFVPGRKAMRFKAAGSLAIALKALHPQIGKGADLWKLPLPSHISDGNWHYELSQITKRLYQTHSLDETLQKIQTIPGALVGTRLRQATGWYKYWVKTFRPLGSGSTSEAGDL